MSHAAALVTLAIGDPPECAMSHPIFRRYASRHGMDFVPIQERGILLSPGWFKPRRNQWLYFEKYQLGRLLVRYERLIYFDSDILLTPQCPSLFDPVPRGHLGCVFEDRGPLWWERWEEFARAQRKLGPLPRKPEGYFNAGVMVLDRAHRTLFDLKSCPPVDGRWPEQTTLNYHMQRLGLPLQPLEPRCNLVAELADLWADESKRRNAWVIHYAGKKNRRLMAKDFPQIMAAWEPPEPHTRVQPPVVRQRSARERRGPL